MIKGLKRIKLWIFLVFPTILIAQEQNCGCITLDKVGIDTKRACKTISLENGNKVVWHVTCDWVRVYLKNAADEVIKQLFELKNIWYFHPSTTFFIVEREFPNSILVNLVRENFSPSDYVLIDKENGEVVEHFGSLVFNSVEGWKLPRLYDFVLYLHYDLATTTTYIVKEYISSKEKEHLAMPKFQPFSVNIEDAVSVYWEKETPCVSYSINAKKRSYKKTCFLD